MLHVKIWCSVKQGISKCIAEKDAKEGEKKKNPSEVPQTTLLPHPAKQYGIGDGFADLCQWIVAAHLKGTAFIE